MNCLLVTEWFIYHIFLSFHQLCVAAVCLNVILNTLFKDQSFSPYHLLQVSVCRWEITVMEYQVLIYCIIDSEMMPPAVLPPVLSPESRTHPRLVYQHAALQNTSTSLLTSQRLPGAAQMHKSVRRHSISLFAHSLWLDKRKGNGLWL